MEHGKKIQYKVIEYHKMFIKKWYLILYPIKDLTVYVDYIVDCREDYHILHHKYS